jgi:c-di-GMP-binding flagellar brake protein YcgR
MTLAGIRTGTKIELEMFDENGDKIVPNFASQMENSLDEKTAIIAAPIFEGNIYPLRLGWHFNAYFRIKDDLYKFRGKIVGRGSNDGIAHIRIEASGNIIKIQRREFFRFECYVPISYRLVSIGHIEADNIPYKNAVTCDLSGGGCAIKLEEEIKLGEIVECKLDLGEDENVYFQGRVVRSVKRREDPKYGFEIGILYRKIDYRDKEAVIKYIFEQQRKLRKKGLI